MNNDRLQFKSSDISLRRYLFAQALGSLSFFVPVAALLGQQEQAEQWIVEVAGEIALRGADWLEGKGL